MQALLLTPPPRPCSLQILLIVHFLINGSHARIFLLLASP